MSATARWVATLLAAALLAVGIVGWWQHADLRAAAGVNQALVDAKATGQVRSVVARGLERVLSYDYQAPDATKQAASAVLSGRARQEYDRLFAKLQGTSEDRRLVLTARVTATGVVELADDTATLLVFVDQSSRRAEDKDADVSAAQLSVTARRTQDDWTITGLEPL